MSSPVTRLTKIETGRTHRKDGSVEFYWVRPALTLGLIVGSRFDGEMVERCVNAFGPQMSTDNPDGRWFYRGHRYYFREENDMCMFVLSLE